MSDNDAIVKRLNVLIRLMLDQQIDEKRTLQKDQLVLMDSIGLTSGDIAEILGRETKDISSLLKRAKDEKSSKSISVKNLDKSQISKS